VVITITIGKNYIYGSQLHVRGVFKKFCK